MQNMQHHSNSMREKNYRKVEIPEEYGPLNSVLHVDKEKKVARVGARTTMECLLNALLPLGLVPKVVPEFKGITVGGAVNGGAIESTSCRHGQFNDSCTGYTFLTGKGVIEASPEENSDLFYGVSGSYGSLGIMLEAEMDLTSTQGYMRVEYHSFPNPGEALAFMKGLKTDAIEAMVFQKGRTVVVSALDISETEAAKLPSYKSKHPASEWFYSHADKIAAEKTQGYAESMSIKDYLFRHDRGAFWMVGYALHPEILLRFWAHKIRSMFEREGKADETFLKYANPRNPGILFRTFFGWLLDSQVLYGCLHNGSEGWFERHFSIQDYYIPWSAAESFILEVLDKIRITPLWLCPVRPTGTPQYFSPHYRGENEEMLLNIGVYGIPFEGGGEKAVRHMEALAGKLDGRKMLYCQTYLSSEEFWKIYPKLYYESLRERYAGIAVSDDLVQKVLSR